MYCRFCANIKAGINLNTDPIKYHEVRTQLTFLNALYIDISEPNLPKTICYPCYSNLKTAYEFMLQVKEAQKELNKLFDQTQNVNIQPSSTNEDTKTKLNFSNVQVKTELKEEFTQQHEKEDSMSVSEPEINSDSDTDNNKFHPVSSHDEMKLEVNLNEEQCSDSSSLSDDSDPADHGPKSHSVFDKRWKDYPWTCGICFVEIGDLNKLRQHSLTDHNKCAEYTCVECEKCYDFLQFIEHVRTHRYKLRTRCPYCDEVYCQKCGNEDIDTHIKRAHLFDVHPCPSCGELFKDNASLEEHLASVKPKRRPHLKLSAAERTCTVCNKVFNQPAQFRRHMEIHSNNRKRTFACSECGTTFFTKSTLLQHSVMHITERKHVCPTCDSKFKTARELKKHIELHTNSKSFTCEVCGKGFIGQNRLNAHKIVHSDTFPFKCEECDKSFKFVQNLKTHKRQHSGEKPYACTVCLRQFTGWANLNKHSKLKHNIDLSKRKKIYAQKTEEKVEVK